MRRLLLAMGWVLAWGLGCSGGGAGGPDKSVVVVPVVGDPEAQHFCCAYTEEGTERYQLLGNAQDCQARHGEQGGRWVEGPECLPCCCKSPPADPSQRATYALVTPSECESGTCVTEDVKECPQPGRRRGRKAR